MGKGKLEALQEVVQGPGTWKALESKQMKAIHRAYREALSNADGGSAQRQANNGATRSPSYTSPGPASAFGPSTIYEANNPLHAIETALDMENVVGASATTSPSGTLNTAGVGSPDDDSATGQKEHAGLIRNDREWYLPRDSCLRSVGGEMLKPRNPPFKDYNAFVASCDFEDWKGYFQEGVGDRYLVETAESICAHICTAQSRKELRVRHGSVPMGRFFRHKREQITPLALCMHELKLWTAHKLRTSSIYNSSTFMEIDARIRYITGILKKEVWGPTSLPLQSGMRAVAHDKLFRLLLGAREDLERARDYSYRGYCRRSSREKLARVMNLLKSVLANSMKITSCLMSVHENLSDPKARRLQPTDLLNSNHNQSFVDYRNIANVCLRRLCEVPLFRNSMLGEFPHGYYLEELEDWKSKNLFCRPTSPGAAEVVILESDSAAGIPEVYKEMAWRLAAAFRANDPSGNLPLSRKMLYKNFVKAFGKEEKVVEILRKLSLCFASLQDLVPSCFAIQVFWDIAGEGGNYTVYDTLRSQIVQVMSNTIERVYIVQASLHSLFNSIDELVVQHKDKMIKRRLRTRKSEYEPPWIANHQVAAVELFPAIKSVFDETFKHLVEVVKDALEYTLTEEQLNEKVEMCKKTALALTEGNPNRVIHVAGPMQGEFSISHFVNISQADWLNVTGTGDASPIVEHGSGEDLQDDDALHGLVDRNSVRSTGSAFAIGSTKASKLKSPMSSSIRSRISMARIMSMPKSIHPPKFSQLSATFKSTLAAATDAPPTLDENLASEFFADEINESDVDSPSPTQLKMSNPFSQPVEEEEPLGNPFA